MNTLLDYAYADNLIRSTGLYGSPSDIYGLIMGLIAGGSKKDEKEFREMIINLVNDGEELPSDLFKWIIDETDFILSQFLARETMPLLLPSDDVKANDRVQAVVDLAHGFLAGFSLKQRRHDRLTHDVQELLRDLENISRMDIEAEDGDDFEKDYVVITEHISIGAQICFEECASAQYPKEHADDFVLEDDDGGAPVKLSQERQNAHKLEEQFWEKESKRGGNYRGNSQE